MKYQEVDRAYRATKYYNLTKQVELEREARAETVRLLLNMR